VSGLAQPARQRRRKLGIHKKLHPLATMTR
jgi:hypothetical protein